MNTNFFNQIAQLDFTGVLKLNISKGAENNLIVSVILNNEQCGDKAKNLIPPLTFNATPQEFDDGFFEQITAPIQTVSGLMVDMEKFLKQLEEVKKQSAMEKEKADKQKKECLVLKKVYTFYLNPGLNLHLFLILFYVYTLLFLHLSIET
jgi:PRTRC genetic system protein E